MMTLEDPGRLVSAEELAEILGVSRRQVWAMSRDGRLPSVKVGRYTRFHIPSVLKALGLEVEMLSGGTNG